MRSLQIGRDRVEVGSVHSLHSLDRLPFVSEEKDLGLGDGGKLDSIDIPPYSNVEFNFVFLQRHGGGFRDLGALDFSLILSKVRYQVTRLSCRLLLLFFPLLVQDNFFFFGGLDSEGGPKAIYSIQQTKQTSIDDMGLLEENPIHKEGKSP